MHHWAPTQAQPITCNALPLPLGHSPLNPGRFFGCLAGLSVCPMTSLPTPASPQLLFPRPCGSCVGSIMRSSTSNYKPSGFVLDSPTRLERSG